jgi:hypothetical protein
VPNPGTNFNAHLKPKFDLSFNDVINKEITTNAILIKAKELAPPGLPRSQNTSDVIFLQTLEIPFGLSVRIEFQEEVKSAIGTHIGWNENKRMETRSVVVDGPKLIDFNKGDGAVYNRFLNTIKFFIMPNKDCKGVWVAENCDGSGLRTQLKYKGGRPHVPYDDWRHKVGFISALGDRVVVFANKALFNGFSISNTQISFCDLGDISPEFGKGVNISESITAISIH